MLMYPDARHRLADRQEHKDREYCGTGVNDQSCGTECFRDTRSVLRILILVGGNLDQTVNHSGEQSANVAVIVDDLVEHKPEHQDEKDIDDQVFTKLSGYKLPAPESINYEIAEQPYNPA